MDARPLTVLEESDVRSLRSSTEGVIWQGIDFPDAPPMPHSSSIGLGQLVSSGESLGGSLTNVFAGADPSASNLDNLDNPDHLAHNLAARDDSTFEVNVLYV